MPLIPVDRTLFEAKLIEELKQHPNLYTKRSQLDFHEYNTIEQSWEIVARKMESDTKTCKKIWRNLRDSFVRQLKKISCSAEVGIDTTQFTKWKHFDKISFLKNVISHRTINESKSSDHNSINEKPSKIDNSDFGSNGVSNRFINIKKALKMENSDLGSSSISNRFINLKKPLVIDNSESESNSISNRFINIKNPLKIESSELEANSISSDPVSDKETFQNDNRSIIDDENNGEITNSFLSRTSNSISVTNFRSPVNEEAFGNHIAKSLENLSTVRRSVAKVKIQEILSEFEQEDARDPVHLMPNIFLNPFK